MRALVLMTAVAAAACGSPATTPIAPATSPLAVHVAAPPTLPPPPPDPDAEPTPRWSRLRVGTLPDGLTYYILPSSKPAHRARIWLAVNAGSVQEDDDQRGVAHIIEHMAFNGTRRFPKNDLIAYLERIGMRFGADINAQTGFDHTIYKLEVPLDDPAYTSKALDMLRDWAGDISFDPAELGAAGSAAKERGVVLEEWRQKRGAAARLFDKQVGVLFDGTRYANRLPIGTAESIQNVSRDAIVRFYKDWYRPDLMAVIVVGDVKDPDAIEQQIRDHFADLPAAAHPRKHESGGVPSGGGTRISIETDPEAPGTVVGLASFAPHPLPTLRRDYRRSLAAMLYTQILRDRLAALARQSASPFTSAVAAIDHSIADADMFVRYARVKQGRAEDALYALLVEVVRIERFGVTPGELERARAALQRRYDIAAERTSEAAPLCEEITRLFFDGEQMSGPQTERQLVHDLLPGIGAAELGNAIEQLAGGDHRVVLISGATANASALPSRERVLANLDVVRHVVLEPWQDRPPPSELMPAPPARGSIVKETSLGAIGAVEWKLSNGITVVVKPTTFDADAVVMRGAGPGGEALASDQDFASTRLANSVARALGVGELDAGALRDVLGGKHVTVTTSIDETRQSIAATGTTRDLEAMLQLVYLRMTAVRDDADEIAAWQQSAAEATAATWNTPEVAFGRDVVDALYQHRVRRMPPDAAAIAAADPQKALAFYKARFGDASGFTFAIVGAVKLDALRPLVETYLASLPASGKPAKERDLGVRKLPGVVVKRWQHGSEPKALVELELHGDQRWSREADDDMYVLGEVMRMELRDVLREDLGGVYHVAVKAALERAPHGERMVLVTFGCDPARVDELVKAVLGVAAQLRKSGPTGDYLDRVREQFTRDHERELRLDESWLAWLASAYRFGDDPARLVDPAPMLARMTPEHVRAAAQRFLDPAQYFEGVMLPEAAK